MGKSLADQTFNASRISRATPRQADQDFKIIMSPAEIAVLVVEDEPLILMNAVDIMHDAGFNTYEATSADDAIAILEQRQDIRAVFTDIQIVGDPDGLRLAHLVRERWPPVGLLITSGRVMPASGELPAGGMFLAKPYAPAELLAALRAVVTANQIQQRPS